jgi:ATP-dependent RNA helicase DDX3X
VDSAMANSHLDYHWCFSSRAGCADADRTQREREDSICVLRNGQTPILIATGVSAHGLDLHNVMHVINCDPPSTRMVGLKSTHRSG